MSVGTIIGIGLTILFGIIAIILARKKIYPAELLYIEDESLNLYDSVVKNITGLEITYKSQPIKENMFLLRGFLFKKGRKDIVPEMIESKLKISLPKNWIWHDSRTISKSEGLNVITTPNKNELVFDFGLFKNNEYIFFESLVEATEKEEFSKSIKFKHRIADTGKVTKEKTIEYKNPLWKVRIPATFLILFSFNFFMYFFPRPDVFDINEIVIRNDKVLNFKDYLALKLYEQIEKLKEQAIKEQTFFDFIIKSHSKNYVIDDVTTVTFKLDDYKRYMIIFSSLFIFISVIFIIRYTIWIIARGNIRRIIKSELKKRGSIENNT